MITDVFRLSLSKFRQSFPLMTYHPIWLITGHLRWTTTDAIGLPGTAYPPGVPGFSHGYWVSQYLLFCVVLLSFACLLVVFPLAIVLSVLFDSRLLITHLLSSKLLLRVGLNEDATFTVTCNRNQFLLSCIGPLVLLLPNAIKLFGFPIFLYWAYLMKVIPETHRAYSIWNLRFYYIRR